MSPQDQPQVIVVQPPEYEAVLGALLVVGQEMAAARPGWDGS
jgi:hypothetical protein